MKTPTAAAVSLPILLLASSAPPASALTLEKAVLDSRDLARRGRAIQVHHKEADAVHRKFSREVAHAVEEAAPAVVMIRVERKDSPAAGSAPGNEAVPGQPQPRGPGGDDDELEKGNGLGTGFFISADGLVLTNSHVVEPLSAGDEVVVFLSDQKQAGLKARVVARGDSETKDLALLQVLSDRKDWPFLAFGDSRKLKPGDWVFALGHPLASPLSASLGVVSGVRRLDVNPHSEYIGATADINRGNSGGPLLNLDGEVVGVNTMIMSVGGGWDGIGLAITSAEVLRALPTLKQGQPLAAVLIGAKLKQENGRFLLAEVGAGSAAEAGGLRTGDMPVAVDGEALSSNPEQAQLEFLHAVKRLAPGEILTVEVERGGRRSSHTVTAREAPPQPRTQRRRPRGRRPNNPDLPPGFEEFFRKFKQEETPRRQESDPAIPSRPRHPFELEPPRRQESVPGIPGRPRLTPRQGVEPDISPREELEVMPALPGNREERRPPWYKFW